MEKNEHWSEEIHTHYHPACRNLYPAGRRDCQNPAEKRQQQSQSGTASSVVLYEPCRQKGQQS